MVRLSMLTGVVIIILHFSSPLLADEPASVNQDSAVQNILDARIAGYFRAYESGDAEAYATWLRENRTEAAYAMAPVEARVEMFAFDVERWGGLELHSIEFPEPFVAVAMAQPRKGGLARRIMFEFEPNPPYRIGPMMIGVAVDIPAEWATLDEFTEKLLEATGVPAFAIGVMQDGKIVDQAVLGERLVGSGEAVTSADTFHWGSIAKSVTGTMIGRLIEEGTLDWDTTIADVLGDMPIREEYRGATVSQLMSHEAGIQPYSDFTRELVDEIMAAAEGDTWTDKRRAFVSRVLMDEPVASPGEAHVYSNAGITIAGYMAEVVTGQSWSELIRKHVFEPAGMTSAGFGWPASPERPDQPRGHLGEDADAYEPRPFGQMEDLIALLAPAGDIRSSVADLLRYGDFHLRGMRGEDGYLKAATVKGLHTPRPDSVPWGETFYTFGWGHDECSHFFDAPMCHAHNGGAGTFYAEIKIIPERNMVLAYMANAAEPSEAIAQDVLAAVYAHFAGQ
ncbi:MAG: serine hydrolase domain-containing protein [Xanthomonadales bacterium]|nr:serine hydrolase domain-containing protein [Xanthomonadales bacterium]